MNKIKLLSIIAIGLLITNLLLASYLVFGRPGPPDGRERKFIVIEKLHFDEGQIEAYEQLIKWHREQMRNSDHAMRELKNELYKTLLTDSATQAKDSLINEISKVQIRIENANYTHFKDIEKLCRPDQMDAFRKFTDELSTFLAPPPPHMRRKK